MVSLKKYCNLSANSILESVIALSIIAVCLYIAVLVYATVFTPKTAPKFYNSRNRINELYYLMELNPDTVATMVSDDLKINSEWINPNLQQVEIIYKDSSGVMIKNNFYVKN